MSHTPGPWKIEWREIVGAIGGPREPVIIGEVYGWSEPNTSESDANAILIAAAPDLLTALCAILPFIPTSSAEEGGALAYSANVRAADMVRAAIAKATGADK